MTPARARTWTAVLLLAAATAGLRLWHVGRDPMWIDELYSMETSAGYGFADHWNLPRGTSGPAPDFISMAHARPAWTVPTVMGNDTHPPLFFILLRMWREIFGDTAAAARGLAVLASVAGVAFLFLLGRELLGKTAALWACAIYALAGPQIQLAREVRGYTLLATLSLAAALLVARIERHGGTRRRFVLLAVCVAAMLLTHYFAVAPVAGLALYALMRFRDRLRWSALGVIVAGGAVFALLWGPMMLRQFRNLGDTNDWVLESRDGNLARTLTRAALLPARYLNEPMQASIALAVAAGLLYVLPLLALRRRRALLLPYLVFVTTALFVAALDVARGAHQVEYVRYTLPAAPFVYLILAGLAGRGRFMRHALPAVVVASCLISLPRAYTYLIPPRTDWPWLTAQMTRDGPVDTLILLGPGADSWITANYLGLHYYMRPRPNNVVVLNGENFTGDATDELRASAGAIWSFTLPNEAPIVPHGFEPERTVSEPTVGTAVKLRPTRGGGSSPRPSGTSSNP